MNLKHDKAENVISDYIESIIRCDYELARSIWKAGDDVSFIHRRGHEKGWDEIEQNFYRMTMDEMFSSRLLKTVGAPDIRYYGENTAVVEFYWDFVATFRDSGDELHTTGRESQVLLKGPDGNWKIPQVHYSGPAVTGEGEGF